MAVKPKRNNRQHQPLTTALRNIIREYPSGGGVLRELTQNADDAGASKIEFVLDETHHPCEPLLHPDLAAFQGPSLLAFNDKPFSDTDFRSLSRIGDSEKAHDLSATGKFGRGFNSVYNWTDGPSILSGSSLLILDPHEDWSTDDNVGQPGGPVYDFVESATETEMVNQLSPFRSIVTDVTRPFCGTVIRLPLRTADQARRSKILDLNPKPTKIADIKDIFQTFAEEIPQSLLFLRNVSSITLKIGDRIFAEGEAKKFRDGKDITASFSINEPYQSVLIRGEQSSRDESYLIRIWFQQDGKETVSSYALTHHMRRHIQDDIDLEQWARTYKLLPWVAIASPLSQDIEHAGRLFSTLPLPVPSDQPAHIHGMFSIRPDRSTIHTGDDSAVGDATESGRGAKWNGWLYKECIVDAWISNLQFIQELTANGTCDIQGWMHWPSGFQEYGERRNLGTGTLGAVFTRIVKDKRKLLPTICGTTAASSDALFATKLDCVLRDALRDAGAVVVHTPGDRLYELAQISVQELGMSYISPSTVRDALSNLSEDLETLTTESRSVLLDYIISDGVYDEVGKCRARLLPLMDGTYQSFQVSKIPYRFSRDTELSLFSECTSYLIDCSKISQSTLSLFNKHADRIRGSMNVRNWDMDGAVWYCKRMFSREMEGNSGNAITRPGLTGWINQFWSWVILIAQRNPAAPVPHSELANLWLIPVTGDRYWKLGQSPVLNISGAGHIARLFRTVLEFCPKLVDNFPLYSGSGLSSEVTAFLQSNAIIDDSEELFTLLHWLQQVPEFLDAINGQQMIELLERVGGLAPQFVGYDGARTRRLQNLLRSLPLFFQAFGLRQRIRLNDIKARYVAVPAVRESLPALDLENTVFIESSHPGITQLLQLSGLVELPSPTEVLEEFVIPNIEKTNGEIKTSLSKFVLKYTNIRLLSQKTRDLLAEKSFVPVENSPLLKRPSELVDPKTPASQLYFDDEHVFPKREYLKEFRGSLKKLKMVTEVSDRVVLDRLKKYSKHPEKASEISAKVGYLLLFAPTPPAMTAEELELRWIPASSPGGGLQLCNSYECRGKEQELVFKYSMSLTELKICEPWKAALGWDDPAKLIHVLTQLDEAVKRKDNAVLNALLKSSWLTRPEVLKELHSRAWIPGGLGNYYSHRDIFFKKAEFHPYTDVLMTQFEEYFAKGPLAVKEAPSFQKLQELHDMLVAKRRLGEADLKVFVLLLDAIAERFPEEDLTALSAPDIDGILRRFTDITAGNHDSHRDDTLMTDLVFIHPTISPRTIKTLKLPTSQDRFLEKMVGPEFIQGFEQEQDLESLISDTLQRYPLESTFSEYLANAEDCGTATKICWVADKTEGHPTQTLITPELSECQGPALFSFNDGVFTQRDLEEVTKIGVSRKREEPSRIGRFGRGSLTMYHWTCTPSYISGEYFAIFDPEQKRLPFNPATRKRRKGMLMKIKDVRRMYPDQLSPFHGLFNFTPGCDSFRGTLFRFPIMKSRSSSKIFSSKMINYSTVLSTLQQYYEDAAISLLFLRNIQSIEFRERLNSLKLVWKFLVSKIPVEAGSNALRCTIESRLRGADLLNPDKTSISIQEWIVLSSTLDKRRLQGSVILETNRIHGVQARCGIAALIAQKPIVRPGQRRRGRLFMDVPTQQELALPVSISADLVVQSDRKTLPLPGQDGAEWNQWILECQIAPLYAVFIEVITTQLPGHEAYRYWPELPPPSKEIRHISGFVSKAFWDMVPSCRRRLFRARAGKTMDYAATHEARFNLGRKFSDDPLRKLLPKLDIGEWKMVEPRGEALSGLRTLKSINIDGVNVISPEFVLELFKSIENSEILQEAWKAADYFSMEFMNAFLRCVTTRATPDTLDGCRILPLATNELGWLQRTEENIGFKFIVLPEDPGLAKAIVGLFESRCVHRGIDEDVLNCLIPKGPPNLNLSRFSASQLPQLVEMLGDKSIAEKYQFAAAVWGWYNKLQDTESLGTLEILKNLPIVATVKATDASSAAYEFIKLVDYNDGCFRALIQSPSDELKSFNNMLARFADLWLVCLDTLPRKCIEEETLAHPRGLYQFLHCIKTLATKKRLTIERLIEDTFENEPRLIESLVKALNLADWKNFPRNMVASAREILKQIPMIPSGEEGKWLPAQNALLAPSTTIILHGLPAAGKFVDRAYAREYPDKLEFLQLGYRRVQLSDFLECYLFVVEGAQVSLGLDRHVQDLEWICSEFPYAMKVNAVAVNGDGRFCTASTLFNHNCQIFQAAFHHWENTFLHKRLRHISWKGTIQGVTSAEIYWRCALGIQEQAENVAETDVSQIKAIMARAKTVVGFLEYETREVEFVSREDAWNLIITIAFVPVFRPSGIGLREKTMRTLLPPKRLITLSDGIPQDYSAICWSQKPLFQQTLCAKILRSTPGHACPTPETVIKHLRFISENVGRDEADSIPGFVTEVIECYRYLQNWREPFSIPADCANSPIWFNADDKNVSRHDVFRGAWVSTQNLCLGLEYDSGPLRQVRPFLKPFIELLGKCRVRELKGPVAPPPIEWGVANHPSRMLSQFQTFRKEGRFFDVEVSVKGEILGVHKVVLCAASKYFQTMFAYQMKETVEGRVDLGEMTAETATGIFDYIYTGEMSPITTTNDPTEELEQLLELLEASNRFLLPELKARAEHALCNRRYIRPESVSTILRCAAELGAQTLRNTCEEYKARNRDIIEREEFE